uniref:Envelope fusion protein n=1 Tax=Musca domestica TaxID=7370 RepID=T1PDA3_MUSDO
MTVTIEKANEDKQHLLDLLKNQTSIIDSTINIIRKDEDTIQRNFGNIQVEMNLLANKVKKEEDVEKATQSIMFLTAQLMLLSSRLKHIEDNLIDVLTDAHHGRISPLLLTPHQLLQELQTIKAHIPPSRALPIREDNVPDFFKLMKSKGRVMKNHIIFEIRLPLVDLQQYDLFKMVPVPMLRSGRFISIALKSTLLAANVHRDEFISLTAEEMKSCIHTTNDVYICDNQTKFNKGDRSHLCEVNFILNKSSEACDLESTMHHQTWRQMEQKYKWMFTLVNSTELSFVCGTKMTHLEVQGAGTLEIGPDCILKDNTFAIYGHYENKTTVHTSYLRLKPLDSIISSSKLVLLNKTLNSTYETHASELVTLHQQLKTIEIGHLLQLMKSTAIHHHIISYLALCIGIGVAIYVTVKFCHHTTSNNNVNPTPIPRQSVSSSYVIDQTVS